MNSLMNSQAKAICVVSSFAIQGSLAVNMGLHVTNILDNLMNFSGLFCVGLAGSADTPDRFDTLFGLHVDKVRAIPKVLIDQLEHLQLVKGHLEDALALKRKRSRLIDELELLIIGDGVPEVRCKAAAQWAVTMVAVGSLLAVATDLLENQTTTPASVASIMAYICRYVLTYQRPEVTAIYRLASELPMLRLGSTVSRALHSREFKMAVSNMREILMPAQQYLTLRVYH